MKLNYRKSQSFVKPDLVDTTSSKKYVYLRQNIIENEITNEQTEETCIQYEYEESKLTKKEYEEYENDNDILQAIEDLKEENKIMKEQISKIINKINLS